jgi:hypothetical protein
VAHSIKHHCGSPTRQAVSARSTPPIRRRSAFAVAALALACSSPTSAVESVPATVSVSVARDVLTSIGDTTRVTALVRDSLGNGIRFPISWRSTNDAILTVDRSGLVTARACGNAIIEGRAGSATGDVFVAVSLPASDPSRETFAPSLGVSLAEMRAVAPGLFAQDLMMGSGLEATPGRSVGVYFSGFLITGNLFDERTSGPPLMFRVGAGQVITGWDLGVVGMRVNGRRRLVVSSSYGYGGTRQTGGIPCQSTLIFDIQLVSAQ